MDNTFDSEYSIQRQILNEIGGDGDQNYLSPYDVQLAILEIILQGGGGGGAVIDDNNVSTGTTYSSNKIVDLLSDAGFDVEIVETLPETGDAHTIYFIASTDPLTLNTYDEFMYINGGWEQVGSTAINLSEYAKISDVDASLNNYVSTLTLTQAQYDSLQNRNPSTLYIISDASVVEFNDYVTKTDLNTSLADYAKIADVDSSLALYAKKTDVNTSLADYATIANVDASLALYAKKTDVNTSLANYAKIADVDTSLANYTTKTYVDASLGDKANTSYVNTYFAKIVSLTQAAYDDLVSGGTVDSSTIYVITNA